MPELTGTKDLRSYLRTFWRWKWLFLTFLIGAPVIAYAVDSRQTPVYQSSVLVGINSATVNSSITGSSGSFSTNNITAIAQLVTTTPVADVAAGLMHPPGNPGQIAGEVTASGDTTTNFLTITAQDPNSVRAAEIANAFARAISLNLQQSAVNQIDNAIRSVRAQLKTTKDAATKLALQQQLQQLTAARSTQGGAAAVLQPATPAAAPAGTTPRRALELGLIIGLLLGIGAVLLAESADRRLRTPEDLENLTDLPLLAAISPTAFAGGLTTTDEDDEAFQMLRTALMYFNVDQRLDSVLITSSGEKDGKTTVATRLAVSAATAGLHVILVDADLRRAQVSARLGLRPDAGLGAVIAGTSQLDDVMVDFPIDAPGAGTLRVLPAGPLPPNPAALMSSKQMQLTLRDLEAQSDLVIVDSPAALAVSDPLPLMRSVSGVVVVARMNQSSRQTIRRLQKIVESAHGNLLGAVATGATAGPGYEHYYPNYYHAQNGTNGHHPSRGLLRGRKRAKVKSGGGSDSG